MNLEARHWLLTARMPVGMLVAGWLLLNSVGLGMFWQYKTTGHQPDGSAVRWPEQTNLLLASDRPTLVMFAHPLCPCTMASLHELTRLLSHGTVTNCTVSPSTAPPRITFVIYQPASAGHEWQTSAFIEAARALPGAEIIWDDRGTIAKKFAATTSGQVQLYHPSGQCLFNGGITRARGHEGENAASIALHSVLQGEESALIQSPVYGCEL